MTKKKLLFFLLIVLGLLFTRLYNLDHTARFTQDESTDLVRMHQYFTEKKLTLVGPISTDNTKVFSSLTYYLILPFVVASGFEPIGPVYGTAFWGIVTAGLLLVAIKKKFPQLFLPAALLVLTWYPLVEMSRWAWNPHFVALWASLGILAYLYRDNLKGWGVFLSAFFFGMLIHHHYLAVFATAPFVGLLCIRSLQKKEYQQFSALALGYIAPVIPFVIFDLRHPPGLFFTKYLLGETPHVEKAFSIANILPNLQRNYFVFLESIVSLSFFKVLAGFLFPLLLFFDFKSKSFKRLLWISPVLGAVIFGVVLNEYQVRYVYPALVFFLFWLLLERKEFLGKMAAKTLFLTLLISSLLTIAPQLTTTKVPPDIYSFTQAAHYIADTIKERELKNANVAALAGLDPAPLAEKYRDIIKLYGASVREAPEYSVSEHLFVVSTGTEESVKIDASFAMQAFRDASLKETYIIPDSPWKVYWYAYQE